MAPTKHGRTAMEGDSGAAAAASSGVGGTGGESPSKRARSVMTAASAASQSQYAALPSTSSVDVMDSSLCGIGAAGGLSSMILCCTGGGGDFGGGAGSTSGGGRDTSCLPLPAVMANRSMGSLGMADLLLEEESTQGRRGVDQAYSDVYDGNPSPDKRLPPHAEEQEQHQLPSPHMADVSTMSATLGQDAKMLEEARQGSCSGNLRRLGSSSLAQSRAGSFLVDMDEEEDYLGGSGSRGEEGGGVHCQPNQRESLHRTEEVDTEAVDWEKDQGKDPIGLW